MAMIRDDADGPLGMVMFRSPRLTYDFRNTAVQRSIAGDVLAPDDAWQILRLRESLLDPDSLSLSTSTRSARPGCPPGTRGASCSSATPRTAPRCCPAWAPAWP
jgi:hypothetical protein